MILLQQSWYCSVSCYIRYVYSHFFFLYFNNKYSVFVMHHCAVLPGSHCMCACSRMHVRMQGHILNFTGELTMKYELSLLLVVHFQVVTIWVYAMRLLSVALLEALQEWPFGTVVIGCSWIWWTYWNDTFITVIPFLEGVRIHKEQNQASKEVGGPKPCF